MRRILKIDVSKRKSESPSKDDVDFTIATVISFFDKYYDELKHYIEVDIEPKDAKHWQFKEELIAILHMNTIEAGSTIYIHEDRWCFLIVEAGYGVSFPGFEPVSFPAGQA